MCCWYAEGCCWYAGARPVGAFCTMGGAAWAPAGCALQLACQWAFCVAAGCCVTDRETGAAGLYCCCGRPKARGAAPSCDAGKAPPGCVAGDVQACWFELRTRDTKSRIGLRSLESLLLRLQHRCVCTEDRTWWQDTLQLWRQRRRSG